MSQSNIVPKSFVPGKKEFFNLPSTTSAPPIANAYGVRPWQLAGIFTATVPIDFGPGSLGDELAFVAIVPVSSGWPSPVILKPADLGMVAATFTLASQPAFNPFLISMPSIQLTWASGTAITPTAGAGSQFILSPGVTYTGPTLNIRIVARYRAAEASVTTMLFTAQAFLYGNSVS
jgi:hypothetical protein